MKKMSRTYKEMRMIAKIYNNGDASIEVINKAVSVDSTDTDLLHGEAIYNKDKNEIIIKGFDCITGEYSVLEALNNKTMQDLPAEAATIGWEIEDWDTMERFYGQGCYTDICDFFGIYDDEDDEEA